MYKEKTHSTHRVQRQIIIKYIRLTTMHLLERQPTNGKKTNEYFVTYSTNDVWYSIFDLLLDKRNYYTLHILG